jgi:prepilin-type N-terminal cleavage/methylation domain-containing protein
MRIRQSGFTLLEIMIAIAILGIIMAMNMTTLQEMFRGTRQQSSIVSSQFETVIGLEILRKDLANVGYGLPDAFLNKATGAVTGTYAAGYSEPNAPATNPAAVALFNDSPGVPRAIVHSNNGVNAHIADGYLADSDYLVIRSPAVGMNAAADKWTYIINNAGAGLVHVWNDQSLDMTAGNRMVVIKPRATSADAAQLVMDGNVYNLIYSAGGVLSNTNFMPLENERYMAYGADNSALFTPFNRADYYVRRTNATGAGCAPGTGTLFKAVVNQENNPGFTVYPVMDCVANMQVVFRLDTDDDGVIDSTVNVIPAGYTTMQIKDRLKEIRVYILAHEGTFDRGYRQDGNGTINAVPAPDNSLGQNVNLTTLVGVDWYRYRWKTYTLFVKPRSLY